MSDPAASPKRLRIGLAGAGHFGRFHALKLAGAPRALLTGIADANPARAASVAQEAGTVPRDLPALLAASDGIIIAASADAHYDIAAAALAAGCHVLVEKPIAATLAQADALAAAAQAAGLVLQVGHLERFSAAYQAVTARLVRPLYIEATRIAPFKPRGTDVSVILDLMIHDLDMVLTLVDSALVRVDAVGVAVASALEDISSARLHFANGAVATMTASRISTKTERRMRIFSEGGYMSVDFANRRLHLVRAAPGGGFAVPGGAGFAMDEESWHDHDSLEAEQNAFIAACLDGAKVVVDAAAGRRALAAALAVATAMAESRAQMRESGLLQGGA